MTTCVALRRLALMGTLGHTPQGLVAFQDLPRPEPLQLYLCSRPGLQGTIAELAADAVRPLLQPELVAQGA